MFIIALGLQVKADTRQNTAQTIKPTNSHQIMFTEVGKYATNTAYMHIKVNIEANNYISALQNYKQLIKMNINSKSHHNATMAAKAVIANSAFDTLNDLISKTTDTLEILPQHHVAKRSLAAFLSFGSLVLGTLFGIRNAAQINMLTNDVNKIKEVQNLIIDSNKITQDKVTHLEHSISNITALLADFFLDNPAVFESGVQRTIFKAMEGFEILMNTIQMAQTHRLSVRLMTQTTIIKLFQEIDVRAKAEGFQPMIEKHSDLFQIETSYLTGPNNQIVLIIHVPMVKEGHMLQLLQFIPFPLSQTMAYNSSITPKVGNQDLLAIKTRRGQTEYKVLSQSDLIGCTKLGTNYLCPERHILNTQLKDTCLGSLYNQHLDGVLQQCEFEITKSQEHVFALGNGQFLVSSPEPFHTSVECGSETHNIKISEMNQLQIQGGCQVQLRQHILLPELQLYADFNIIHFEWNWNPAELFPQIHDDYINQIISTLQQAGAHSINIKDIQKWKIEHQSDTFKPMINFIIITTTLLIIIIAGASLCLCYKCEYYRWDSCAIKKRDRNNRLRYAEARHTELQPISSSKAAEAGNAIYPQVPSIIRG
jgi:hypothetical protein